MFRLMTYPDGKFEMNSDSVESQMDRVLSDGEFRSFRDSVAFTSTMLLTRSSG